MPALTITLVGPIAAPPVITSADFGAFVWTKLYRCDIVCALMKRFFLVFLWLLTVAPGAAGPIPSDYPQSLVRDLKRLQEVRAADSSDPRLLLELARIYLDIGDDLWTDSRQRIAAYEEGARMA